MPFHIYLFPHVPVEMSIKSFFSDFSNLHSPRDIRKKKKGHSCSTAVSELVTTSKGMEFDTRLLSSKNRFHTIRPAPQDFEPAASLPDPHRAGTEPPPLLPRAWPPARSAPGACSHWLRSAPGACSHWLRSAPGGLFSLATIRSRRLFSLATIRPMRLFSLATIRPRRLFSLATIRPRRLFSLATIRSRRLFSFGGSSPWFLSDPGGFLQCPGPSTAPGPVGVAGFGRKPSLCLSWPTASSDSSWSWSSCCTSPEAFSLSTLSPWPDKIVFM